MSQTALETLATPRDWLRYAVSRFNAAGLAYGHGTATSLDEAAYLILHTLHLPIDKLDPFLDARLLPEERLALNAMIERRVATRKPASYLTNEAWIGPHAFYVDERVIVPRSYIGELLCEGLSPAVPDPSAIHRVLDLCTGSGCLAILAALAFPDATVDAADVSRDALAVAHRNVQDYGLDNRITLYEGDLFAPLGEQRYDLIIANPPYVAAEAMRAFPPEHRAEPAIAHAGGVDGLDIVRRILAGAAAHLTQHGILVMEIGQGRALLERERPDLSFIWLDTAESEGEVAMLAAADLSPAERKSAKKLRGKTSTRTSRQRS